MRPSPVSEEVVHVHALAPSLLVPNLHLVLEVDNQLGLAREGVHKATAIGSRNLENMCQVT